MMGYQFKLIRFDHARCIFTGLVFCIFICASTFCTSYSYTAGICICVCDPALCTSYLSIRASKVLQIRSNISKSSRGLQVRARSLNPSILEKKRFRRIRYDSQYRNKLRNTEGYCPKDLILPQRREQLRIQTFPRWVSHISGFLPPTLATFGGSTFQT